MKFVFSSRLVHMSSSSFDVGFLIHTIACFLFFLVERKFSVVLLVCWMVSIGNDLVKFFLALITEEAYNLTSFRVSMSQQTPAVQLKRIVVSESLFEAQSCHTAVFSPVSSSVEVLPVVSLNHFAVMPQAL